MEPDIRLGEEDEQLHVYKNDDGTVTVMILKRRGSAKFTCQGTDYAAAHHKSFPAPKAAGVEPAGSEGPKIRYTV